MSDYRFINMKHTFLISLIKLFLRKFSINLFLVEQQI